MYFSCSFLPAESITAGATVALAALALASAIYARLLWLEARKQFEELKRSTDMDVVLRMLARCDDPDVIQAEQGIKELNRAGALASRAQLEAWAAGQPVETRNNAARFISTILTTFEHVGVVARNVPSAAAVLIDYLSLRAPELYDDLASIIDEDRQRTPLAHSDFKALSDSCREFAVRTRQAPG
jgi:hypothetical protein